MRYFVKQILSGVLAVVMISSLFCTAASAAVQSSAYLDGYSASITPKANGDISVTVNVAGVGRMTEIGAKTIYIYESDDGVNFNRVATYESSKYPEMLGSGTNYYKTPITHEGTTGYYYYAVVYVYAGNSSGGDSRRYETSIKQAI